MHKHAPERVKHVEKQKAAPNKVLKLARAISETDTIIPLGGTAGIGPYAGTVEIEGEKIVYTMASDNSLHGCIRGHDGTGGSEHPVDATVTFLGLPADVPLYVPKEQDLHKASETDLGVLNPEYLSEHRAPQTDPVVNSVDQVVDKSLRTSPVTNAPNLNVNKISDKEDK